MHTKSQLIETITDSGSRIYKIKKEDGSIISLSSVTTILGVLDKPALKSWMINKAVDYVKHLVKSYWNATVLKHNIDLIKTL